MTKEEAEKIKVGYEGSDLTVIVDTMMSIDSNSADCKCIYTPVIPRDDYNYVLGISLEELKRQIEVKYKDIAIITVISEMAMSGVIFQWGNHGNFWEIQGSTKGFA